MDFIADEISEYALQHSGIESPLLAKLSRETQAEVLYPRMLSGHLQGRVLALISKLIKPRRILEIGTYTGYSAICLSEGLAPDGLLVTIDSNDELEERVRGYFAEAGLHEKIDYRLGDAREILPELKETFDLIFLDADKISYPHYYHLLKPLLNHEGVLVADNVLWSGKVIDSSINDPETEALRRFNELVQNDPEVEKVLLPVRDGLFIIRKLA